MGNAFQTCWIVVSNSADPSQTGSYIKSSLTSALELPMRIPTYLFGIVTYWEDKTIENMNKSRIIVFMVCSWNKKW